MPETADALTQWASCNFSVLMFIVVITIVVLFILAMLSMVRMFMHRKT